MKLTARMLADQLGQRLIEARIPDSIEYDYEIVHLALASGSPLHAGKAYVVTEDQLCMLADIDPSCLILSSGYLPVSLPCAVLVCRGTAYELMETALDAFARYQRLENELNTGLLEERDLDYFLETCAAFFGATMQLLDPALNIVAGVEPLYAAETGEFTGFRPFVSDFTTSLVSEMFRQNLLRETFEFRSAQYFKSPVFADGAIHLNIFNQENYCGKLLMIENIHPFSPGMPDAVDRIGRYFKHLLTRRRAGLNVSLFTAEYFIAEILAGRISDAAFIAAQLAAIGWTVDGSVVADPCHILCLGIAAQDLLGFYAQSLKKSMPDAIVFPLEDHVVAVIRLTADDFPGVSRLLTGYLREAGLQGGLSERFTDFTAARSFYIQSCQALRIGQQTGAPQVLFHYDDFAVGHALAALVEREEAQAFLHPAYLAIQAYDRKNNTDYLITLSSYLRHGGNQVATAKDLHVHRNSLKYRLARLKEIGDADIDDPDQRLRLVLSIHLADLQKRSLR